MHRKRNLLLALLLLVILAAALAVLLRQPADEPDAEPAAEDTTIYSIDPNRLTAISWTVDGTTLAITKEGERWVCDALHGAAVDQTTANTLATLLGSVSYLKDLTDSADRAAFGLDSPRMTLKLYLGDVTASLNIGVRNAFAGGDYAAYGEKVYLIATDLYDAFAISPEMLLVQDALPAISNADLTSLTIQNDGAEITLLHPADYAALSYSGSYTWFREDGDRLTALDESSASAVASALTGSTFGTCVAWEPEELATYGLDAPSLVHVAYNATDVNGVKSVQEFTLELGCATEPEQLLGDADALDELDTQRFVYARMAGSSLIYTFPEEAAQTLLSAPSADLLPTDVCKLNWAKLKVMNVTLDGITNRLAIDTMQDQDADGNLVSSTVYSIDGREVEYDDVYGIFKQLRYMTCEGTDDSASPSGEPYLTVQFHQDSDIYATMTLKLYPYDNSFYLVDFAGASRILVSRRDVEALAESIEALR